MSLRAQGAGTLVRGRVIERATGQPLEHAMVSLLPVGRQTFSNAEGQFGFAALPPGASRLRVARRGFTPRELAVLLTAGADPPVVQVELDRASFSLAAVRVLAYPPCKRPGPPDPRTSPDFASIFELVRQNAEQYRLLADSFPIRRAELDLSIVPEPLRDVVRAHVTTIFRGVSPAIVVFDVVRGTTVLRPSRATGAFAESFEEQRLLEFGWLRAEPGRLP